MISTKNDFKNTKFLSFPFSTKCKSSKQRKTPNQIHIWGETPFSFKTASILLCDKNKQINYSSRFDQDLVFSVVVVFLF